MVLRKITSAPAPSRQAPAPTGPSRIVITPTGIQQVSIAPPPPPPTRIIAPPPAVPRTAQIRSPEEIARTNAELNDLHAIHVVESPSSSFIGPQQPTQQPSSQIQQSYITPATIYREPTPRKLISFGLPPAVPGLIGGVIPLTAASVSTLSNAPKPSEEENIYSVKGFKTPTSKGGAEAFDLSEKVLSETYTPMEYSTQIVKGGEPIVEVGPKYIDPSTGLLTQDTKTTTPGDIVTTTGKGGVSQTLGQSEIKPDFSDPLGSIFGGARDTTVNELIGVKNIGAIVVGKEQEEQYATPLAVAFGGLFEAGSIIASDIGGSVFDFGRQVARKAPVEVGQSVTTFGIGGDQITIEQKPRQGFEKAITVASEAKQRAERIIVADPYYALGEALVQVPLFVVAPLKAASVALKGIGFATKAAKGASIAVKAITKGEKAIPVGEKIIAKGKPTQAGIGYIIEPSGKPPSIPLSSALMEGTSDLPGVSKAFARSSAETKAETVAAQRNAFDKALQIEEGVSPAESKQLAKEAAERLARSNKAREELIERAKIENLPPGGSITEKQISPALKVKLNELEKTGIQEDLFPSSPGPKPEAYIHQVGNKVTPDNILNPGFTSTKIDLGTGLGRFEKGGADLFGGGKGTPPYQYPSEGVFIKGTDIEIPQRGTYAEAKKAQIEASKTRIREAGGEPSKYYPDDTGGVFTTTEAGLGKGTGSLIGDIGKVDESLSGKAGGGIEAGDFLQSPPRKISDQEVDKFLQKVRPADSEATLFKKNFLKMAKTDSQKQLLIENEQLVKSNFAKEAEQTAAQSQKLFELEKARTALKKTKASKAISGIEDQATQRKLSELIKEEKLKKPSTTADKLTQNALRKLINEEKTAIAERTAAKIAGKDTIDILRSKPRGLASGAESIFDESLYRKPGSKLEPGIFGVATGVAAGTALGLGLDFGVKPQVKTQPQIYDQVLTQKPSQVSVTKQIFESGLVQKQSDKQIFDFNYFQQPTTRQTTKQITKQQTDIFQIPTTRQTTKQTTKQQEIFEQQTYQPIEEVTTNQLFPPGIGGLPFGGNRMDIVGEQKNPRKFYRLFDIAKTPFGRVEIGVGAQIQSDRPIFEFSEERPNITRPKRKRNISERFFDTSEPQDLFF